MFSKFSLNSRNTRYKSLYNFSLWKCLHAGDPHSGSLYKLSFSKGHILMIFDPAPSDLRAEVNGEEQALGMISIPLG